MDNSPDKTPSLGGNRRLAEIILIAAVYFLLARLGQLLAIPPGNVTPVWPASGFALAAVLLRGNRVWPGIWLGSFLGNTWAFFDTTTAGSTLVSLAVGTVIALGATLQVVVGARIVRRFSGETSLFYSIRGVGLFLFSVGLSCLIAASFGVTALCTSGIVEWGAYGFTWFTWYLGDGIGVILVTPLLFAVFDPQKAAATSPRRPFEATLLLALAFGVSWMIFYGMQNEMGMNHSLLYLLIPVVLWSAVRPSPLVSATAVLLITSVAVVGTSQGRGPLALDNVNQSLLLLQLFMGVVMTTALVMSASKTEQGLANERATRYADELSTSNAELRRQAAELKAAERELTAIVGTAPDAILTFGRDGSILSANPSAGVIFGAAPASLVGLPVGDLLLSLSSSDHRHDDDEEETSSFVPSGDHVVPMSQTTLAQRRDGSLFSAEYNSARAMGADFSVVVARDVSERTELESSVLSAAEIEKERIARDLHDGLGSLLGGVDCLAKALEHKLSADGHDESEKAAEIGREIKKSIRMTRRLSHGLYSVGAQPDALVEALGEFALMTESRVGIPVRFHCPEAIEIHDRLLANHLFRIAQEAVTNAIRHSGSDTIEIALERRGSRLRLRISDQGCGIPADIAKQNAEGSNEKVSGRGGIGLRTMSYRARVLHGVLELSSLEGSGTSVTCYVPFPDGKSANASS